MLIIAANTALGLYGGGWRTRLCGADVAARLVGPEYAAVELADAPAAGSPPDTAVWAAVDREPDGGGILPGLLFEPHIARDGLPDAVARLRPQRGLIDSLVLSVPRKTAGRENPEWHEAAGYCIDQLLLAWCTHLADGGVAGQGFEDLRVAWTSGGVAAAEREPIRHKSKLFERRGFAQIDESFAAGALITHRARLPRAVVAYESLLSSPTASADERERYRAVLWALRRLPPPCAPPDSEFAA